MQIFYRDLRFPEISILRQKRFPHRGYWYLPYKGEIWSNIPQQWESINAPRFYFDSRQPRHRGRAWNVAQQLQTKQCSGLCQALQGSGHACATFVHRHFSGQLLCLQILVAASEVGRTIMRYVPPGIAVQSLHVEHCVFYTISWLG